MILSDIHCHILPGVDDGSGSMDESIRMIYAAKKEGIERIILTPHYHEGRAVASRGEREEAFEALKKELRILGVNMDLYLGNEVFVHDGMVRGLKSGEIATLNGTDYVLIEFHPSHDFNRIRQGIYDLLEGGYKPVIAHIERYEAIVKDIDRAYELDEMGALIQVNAHPITDGGFVIKSFLKKLFKDELISFVATDAHRATGHRAPHLRECAELIEKKYGREYAEKIFITNPGKVIAGEM